MKKANQRKLYYQNLKAQSTLARINKSSLKKHIFQMEQNSLSSKFTTHLVANAGFFCFVLFFFYQRVYFLVICFR